MHPIIQIDFKGINFWFNAIKYEESAFKMEDGDNMTARNGGILKALVKNRFEAISILQTE